MELTTIELLINSFSKLPGIGPKSAEKLAYFMLDMPKSARDEFISSIKRIDSINKCPKCGLYCEEDFCNFCNSETRNKEKIMVVAEAKDAITIEKTNYYDGLYHVLGGLIATKNGIGPDDLTINELIQRIHDENIKEVIIATSPTIEGQTTAFYIGQLLKDDTDLSVYHLGYGLPMGGSLDYADIPTLIKSMEARKKIN